jgi:hypothetical protein
MTMPNATGAIRDVVIAPPSLRHELLTVVRIAMAITFGVWLYLANSPFAASGLDVSRRSLLPFQAFVRDRPADDQRMFRELQVGLLEAETVRSMSGAWPAVEALAAEGIEPFAVNPALKGPRYAWQMLRDGRFINYVGRPIGGSGTAWLLLVQEPDPAAPELFRADEEHHQLVDGSVLHVSTWSRPNGSGTPAPITRAPQFEGWTQLYAVSAPSAHSVLPPAGP